MFVVVSSFCPCFFQLLWGNLMIFVARHAWWVRKGFIAALIWLWDCDLSFGTDGWSLKWWKHNTPNCATRWLFNRTWTKPALVVIAANLKKLFHTLVCLLFGDSYFTLPCSKDVYKIPWHTPGKPMIALVLKVGTHVPLQTTGFPSSNEIP